MKRFLHALAALWPERRGEGSPPLPDTRIGILQHGAAVLRMDRLLCECVDLPIRKFAKETVGAGALGELVRSDGGLKLLKRQQSKSANTHIRESAPQPNNLTRVRRPMPLLIIVIPVIFMCLMAAKQVSAQAEPAAAASHRIKAYQNENIIAKVRADSSYDLEIYPMVQYEINNNLIKPLRIGDRIPDDLLDLPLWVVSGGNPTDTLTMREVMQDNLLVIDFWASWCKPCVESMNKWEGISKDVGHGLVHLGAHIDFDYKAYPFVTKRGWKSSSVIGVSAHILNRSFFERSVISRAIWILDGTLIAITGNKGYDANTVAQVINRRNVEVPMALLWTHSHQNL